MNVRTVNNDDHRTLNLSWADTNLDDGNTVKIELNCSDFKNVTAPISLESINRTVSKFGLVVEI